MSYIDRKELSYNNDITTLENTNTLDEDTIESTCLYNLVICFTGFDADELSQYEEQIHLMGGKFSPHLTSEVTHLISKNTDSEKYKCAVNLNIPIIQDKWIKECWNRRLEVGFTGKRIASEYILPPFVNVQICVTGISGEEREEIENFTRVNGGRYSADLTHQCTHLIIEKPEGKKYEFAKLWGLFLVHKKWFDDCVKRQARIDERDYLLENNVIDEGEDNYNSDETYDMNDHEDDENFEFLINEEENKATLENKEINFNYLERCIIYLGSGFETDKLILLKRCILYGGGTRYSDFNSKVTHFIVKSKKSINKSDKNILDSTPNQCIVVNYKWLQRCFIEKKLCSVDDYKIERPHEILSLNSQIMYQDDEDENENNNKGKIKIRNSSMSQALNFDVNNMYQDLLNQNNFNNDGFIENKKTSLSRKNSKINPNKMLDMKISHQENNQNHRNKFESTIIQPISKLFEGLDFVSKGFSPEHEQIIEKEVLKHSGQYYHSETLIKNNYYQVLPFLNTLNFIISQKAIVVTEHWLERCLTDDILHNPEENPIFIPCTLEIPIEEFNGVVIGITGFNGIERAHIGKLITKLGAIYSDTLTRKHNFLICNPDKIEESLKYQKALEWNIPVLEVNWIYDCFRQERRLPYERYILGNKTKSKSEREAQLIKDNDLLSTLSTLLSNDRLIKEPEEMQIDQDNHEDVNNNDNNINDDSKETETEKEKEKEKDNEKEKEDTSNKDEKETEPQPPKEENPELLKGVVISISQRLSHRKNELWELATKMGAECIVKYDDTCTHYIHSGVRAKESFKDFKLAYSKKKFIVSPVWLQKCYELQQRLPEKDYPHTYNPNKQLQMKTAENNQNSANVINFTNDHTNHQDSISSSKLPLELNRNHSSANLNSFFENYVSASKTANTSNESNNNNKNNSDNNNTNNSKDYSSKKDNNTDTHNKEDHPTTEDKDETDNEKAEGYVSAMDNIIKMTSMRRRPRSLRRDTSNDKTKTNKDTNKEEIDNSSNKLDLENPKRKFVEENDDEGFVKIDDPEARMEKLKLLDKVNQNKKRIKTISPNATNIPPEENNNNTNVNIIPDEHEDTNQQTTKETEDPVDNNETETDNTKMEIETDKDNPVNDNDPMDVDINNNDKPALSNDKSILINDDKVRIKKESVPIKKNVEVYDESFVINRNNLRNRRASNNMCFMFSIIKNELRSVYAKKIKALGGKVSEKDHWDEACTHLIIKEPNRGEKYLAAIASGVWILKPEYMEESIKQGKFVNEEEYEWGRNPDDSFIAKAAPRWRLSLENYLKPMVEKNRGSFEGWDILLMVDAKKREGFTRLLKAGKGKVTLLKTSFRNIKNKQYTHFFIDGTTRNRLKDISSLSYLTERNILCYDAQYIAEYLISPNPQPNRFEIKINK